MKEYEPELGQAVFGQPWQEIECPDYIESHLSFISNELKRVMLNLGKDFENPFGNTGNVTGFKNNIFEVHAYDWSDPCSGCEYDDPKANIEYGDYCKFCTEGQSFNFKYKNIEVSWYKYLGRGMSINRQVSPDEAAQMLKDCINSLWEMEKEYFKDDPDYE
ncbi:MAG: hypothetical protein WC476_00805 [Phycisphaerae bacterium]|jgi:hypothetical protein